MRLPRRNSKLTMLLQDSLGGDAKALMLCCVAPSAVHASETMSSLAFASKVSCVVLRTPQRRLEDASEGGKKATTGGGGAAGAAAAAGRGVSGLPRPSAAKR